MQKRFQWVFTIAIAAILVACLGMPQAAHAQQCGFGSGLNDNSIACTGEFSAPPAPNSNYSTKFICTITLTPGIIGLGSNNSTFTTITTAPNDVANYPVNCETESIEFGQYKYVWTVTAKVAPISPATGKTLMQSWHQGGTCNVNGGSGSCSSSPKPPQD